MVYFLNFNLLSVRILLYQSLCHHKDLYLACLDYIYMFKYNTTKNNAILIAYYRSLPQSKGFKLVNKLYYEKWLKTNYVYAAYIY